MAFPLNIYLLSLAGAAVITALTMPLWLVWCRRTGVVDDPGHRKIHAETIPLAGGLAVMTGLLLPWAILAALLHWQILDAPTVEKITHGLGRRSGQLFAILGGAIGMLLVGWLDDKYELRPLAKFGAQCLIALLVAKAGIRITLFVPNHIFSFAVTMLWILTLTNAFNFMDNMNGLCSGLALISAAFFGINAGLQGQYLVAALAFLVAGAVLGFLPYNFPKAKSFLGDAGSHLLGFLLAVLAILPHFYSAKHPHRLSVLTPLLVLAVPLLDLVWVVILRWKLGQPFYVGDNNHLSHRLVRRGFSRVQAVMLIWLLAFVFAAASVSLNL